MAKRKILSQAKKRKSALKRADAIIKAVSKVGFQWPDLKGPLAKIEEELDELKVELRRKPRNHSKIESEMGDLLFTICNLSYFLQISPEQSLQKMLRRFESRFNFVEKSVHASGRPWKSLSFEELDQFWDSAKRIEKRRKQV